MDYTHTEAVAVFSIDYPSGLFRDYLDTRFLYHYHSATKDFEIQFQNTSGEGGLCHQQAEKYVCLENPYESYIMVYLKTAASIRY